MRVGKTQVLLVVFLCAFSQALSLQVVPPILPMLIQDFGLGYTLASSLMWLAALPGLFLSILGGVLTGRYGVRRLSIAGLTIVTASSLLSSFSSSMAFMQFSRLMVGVGGVFLVVSAPSLLFQWFERKELGAAMGIFGLGMPLAVGVSFNALGPLASIYGWRSSFLAASAVSFSALILCVLFMREKSERHHDTISLASLGSLNIWILGGIWSLFNMAVIGYTTWSATVFVKYDDLPVVFADLLASLIFLGFLTNPLTGFISDRLGRRRLFIVFSSVSMSLVFPLFLYVGGGLLTPLALMLGLLASFLPPAVFALPEEILGAGKGPLGWGVLNTGVNLSFILGPLAVGYALDVTNSKTPVFFSLAAFTFLCLVLALILKSK